MLSAKTTKLLMGTGAIAALIAIAAAGPLSATTVTGNVAARTVTAPMMAGSLPAGAYKMQVTSDAGTASEVVDISGSATAPVLTAANGDGIVTIPLSIGGGNRLSGQASVDGSTWAFNGTVSALPGTHTASGTTTLTQNGSVVTVDFTLEPTTITPLARVPKQSNAKPPKTLLGQLGDWLGSGSSSSGTAGSASSSGSGSTAKGLSTYTPPH